MQTYQVGLIGLAVFAVFVVVAFLSWRAKGTRQEKTLPEPRFVDGLATGMRCLYVTTTFADRPLDRVIAHGLAHRGNAFLENREDGLVIHRTGERSFLIPTIELIDFSRTSAVIDRAVEKDGLVSVRWRLGEAELESHFRFVDPQQRKLIITELSELIGARG